MVTNEQFNRAYNDKKNKNIINKVLRFYKKKYNKLLDNFTLKSCGQVGLLRCIQKHIDGKGNQFSTSLYQFVQWECQDAVRSLGRQYYKFLQFTEKAECLLEQKKYCDYDKDLLFIEPIIKMRFVEGYCVEEISKKLGVTKAFVNKSIAKHKRIESVNTN